uniref:NADH dehydrogenase [ubiquinone] 1 alpha subcomplex subunit n=1 Tax=Angiostrongylus cantonensis TaxID=6313 RepID=A0A0K0D4F9_ANGCA
MLRTTHRAYMAGMRSSDLRNPSHLRDPGEYTSTTKHRWVGHIMRRTDDRWTKRTVEWTPRECKRPLGRPPTRWADVFVNKVNQLYPQLHLLYRSRYETGKRYHARARPPP